MCPLAPWCEKNLTLSLGVRKKRKCRLFIPLAGELDWEASAETGKSRIPVTKEYLRMACSRLWISQLRQQKEGWMWIPGQTAPLSPQHLPDRQADLCELRLAWSTESIYTVSKMGGGHGCLDRKEEVGTGRRQEASVGP